MRLTRHAIERYIARCCGCRRLRVGEAFRELEELRDAGEVVRAWPVFLPDPGRFEKRAEVYAFVVVEWHDPRFAMPVQTGRHDGLPTATTLLVEGRQLAHR